MNGLTLRSVCTAALGTLTLTGCATIAKIHGIDPPGPIAHPGIIELPKVFDTVWYRPEKRGMSLKAYSATGTLTVGTDDFVYDADDNSVRIPIESVRSLAWGKIGNDTYNDWAIVEYLTQNGPTRVCFRDGRDLGHGPDSDLIYATMKYAAVVRGGVEPDSTVFNSGWIDHHGAGVISQEGRLALATMLSSKAPRPVWVSVRFTNPGPDSTCQMVVLVNPDEPAMALCPQERMHADTPYRVLADVYLDENLTSLVDRCAMQYTWTAEDIAAFERVLIQSGE